jgi:hypothetical protein
VLAADAAGDPEGDVILLVETNMEGQPSVL